MNRQFILAAFSALLLSCISTGTARGAESHVKASLIANVSAVVPGEPFRVGVLLQIDPGWHIYWTNPGDSGAATRVEFIPPSLNVPVKPDRFPIPTRIQQAANEVVYGYENSVLLTARVRPQADLGGAAQLRMTASANWLVCKEQCMPGKVTLELTLNVADHAEPANIDVFEKLGSTVIAEGNPSPDVVGAVVVDGSQAITVHWKTTPTNVEVFPYADDELKLSDIVVGTTKDATTPITLKAKILKGEIDHDRLPVLIAYTDSKGRRRGFETSVPLK